MKVISSTIAATASSQKQFDITALNAYSVLAESGHDCLITPRHACMSTSPVTTSVAIVVPLQAVCGIGLDTVPIPGATPAAKIAALMTDTGTMAFRLDKPLTVRLFPCLGLKAGDMTKFTSADLCNCAVFAVP